MNVPHPTARCGRKRHSGSAALATAGNGWPAVYGLPYHRQGAFDAGRPAPCPAAHALFAVRHVQRMSAG